MEYKWYSNLYTWSAADFLTNYMNARQKKKGSINTAEKER